MEDSINFSRIPFISAKKQIEHYQLGFNGIFFKVQSMKITEYNLKLRSSDRKESKQTKGNEISFRACIKKRLWCKQH